MFFDLHTPEQTSCSQGKRPIVAVNGSARNASYSSPFSAPVQLRLRSSFVTISTFSKLSPTRPQWPCLNQITLPSAKSSSRQPRCGSRNGPLEWHRPRRHSCFRTRDDQWKETKVTSKQNYTLCWHILCYTFLASHTSQSEPGASTPHHMSPALNASIFYRFLNAAQILLEGFDHLLCWSSYYKESIIELWDAKPKMPIQRSDALKIAKEPFGWETFSDPGWFRWFPFQPFPTPSGKRLCGREGGWSQTSSRGGAPERCWLLRCCVGQSTTYSILSHV